MQGKKGDWGLVRARFVAMAAFLGLVAVIATSCGSGSSATGSTDPQGSSQSEPSSQFFGKSAANQFSKFGKESDSTELEEASAIVAKSLAARAARHWAEQCATLSKKAVNAVETSPVATKGAGCPRNLAAQGKTASKEILEDNLKGAVVALRVKSSQGYALYHGTDKKDWAMPMAKEGGAWKVGALVAEEIPY